MSDFINSFPPIEDVLKMDYRLGVFRNDKKNRLEVVYGHAGTLKGVDQGGHVVAWADYFLFEKSPTSTFKVWRESLRKQPWSVLLKLPGELK